MQLISSSGRRGGGNDCTLFPTLETTAVPLCAERHPRHINVEQKNEKGFLCSVSFEMPVEAAPGTICLGQPENQPQAEGM